jgi:hypothetical protein
VSIVQASQKKTTGAPARKRRQLFGDASQIGALLGQNGLNECMRCKSGLDTVNNVISWQLWKKSNTLYTPPIRLAFVSLHSLPTSHTLLGYGNGYPLPKTRWVFALLGYGFESISLPMGLLMGLNGNPTGTWAWVCSSTTHTRKPMSF